MRKTDAQQRREAAARIAHDRQHPVHVANGEERAYRDAKSFMSFTKGLPHCPQTGLVRDHLDPVRLRTAIDSGYSRDFDLTVPLGDRDAGVLQWRFFDSTKNSTSPIALQSKPDADQHRRWEAPTAGWVYDLEGPDAQAVTMPPAPPIVVQKKTAHHGAHCHSATSAHGVKANPELVAEMSEVYWLALLRDQPLAAFDDQSFSGGDPEAWEVQNAVDHLAGLEFYDIARDQHPRRRLTAHDHRGLTRQNVFRGHTPGERKGPYLSQFMLMGSKHLGGSCASPHSTEDGYLRYGSITIDMRVRTAEPCRDYMTHWNEWLDVQNGANVGDAQTYAGPPTDPAHPDEFRFIATPRDLATYVHFDALYEAYLNACVWLLNVQAPFDPNFRHLLGNTRHTTGFALFGGPHILSLMTEVATRGLKAVRFQKFNNHLRLRPEALAGLVAAHSGFETLIMNGGNPDRLKLPDRAAGHVKAFHDALDPDLLNALAVHNAGQNTTHPATYTSSPSGLATRNDLPLLPMAFAEGSPMHPSYGAGHATVAGACVTILKAFFDEDACIARITNAQHDNVGDVVAVSPDEISNDRTRPAGPDRKDYIEVAFVPDKDGKLLDDKVGAFGDFLRVGDELNKLAANISIARNMAGVHYYSDYIDSLRMGEQIALGVLQEQSIMYPKDPFQVSLTSFDGKRVIIGDGEIQCLGAETEHHTPKHYPQSEALEDLIAALEKSPDLGKKLLASFSEKMPANDEKPGTKVA